MTDEPKKTATLESVPHSSFNGKNIVLLFRFAIVLLLIWTLVIGISLIWSVRHHNSATRELAKNEARIAFNRDLSIRVWASTHGGVYVPTNERTPPSPYLAHIPDRDITTPSGKKLTLMNPAYLLRQMMSDASDKYGPRGHITSLKPLNPINAPDEWERVALLKFQDGEREVLEFIEDDSGHYLRLMRPLLTQKSCLKCHGHQGYKEGDIRGGVGVTVNMAPYLRLRDQGTSSDAIFHGGIWILGVAGIGFGLRQARRRILENQKAEEKLLLTRQELMASKRLAAIGELAAGVSHEVLNPLNIISIHVQLFKNKFKDDPELKSFYDKVRHEIERIQKITEGLYKFSGKNKFKLEKVKVPEIMGEVISLIEQDFTMANISIKSKPCEAPCMIWADKNQIRQALLNLVNNAKYSMPGGGELRINSVCRNVKGESFIEIKVSDTGTGIKQEHLERLFDPFFTTKDVGEGAGMGLPVVHGIIESHGGTISGKNNDGKGASFTIRLPMA